MHKKYRTAYEKECNLHIHYSELLQKFMSVYTQHIQNANEQMIFYEFKKAIHTFLQNKAIKAFEAVLELNLQEFETLQWLFEQESFRDIKRTYKNNARKDKFCNTSKKTIPCSPPGHKQPFEIELFGRQLSQKERQNYF